LHSIIIYTALTPRLRSDIYFLQIDAKLLLTAGFSMQLSRVLIVSFISFAVHIPFSSSYLTKQRT